MAEIYTHTHTHTLAADSRLAPAFLYPAGIPPRAFLRPQNYQSIEKTTTTHHKGE